MSKTRFILLAACLVAGLVSMNHHSIIGATAATIAGLLFLTPLRRAPRRTTSPNRQKGHV